MLESSYFKSINLLTMFDSLFEFSVYSLFVCENIKACTRKIRSTVSSFYMVIIYCKFLCCNKHLLHTRRNSVVLFYYCY